MNLEYQLEWSKWNLHSKNIYYNYNIYIAKEIPGVSKNELFPRSSPHPTLPDINLISKLRLTSDTEKADYILVPHAWRDIKNDKGYLVYLKNLSHQTPLLIVNSGDVSSKCTLENIIELRTFLHPWERINRKIVLPYPVKEKDFIIRKWKPIPRISFMGYVPKLGPGSLFGENFQGLTKPIKSSVYINRKISLSKLNKLSSEFDVFIEKRSSFTAYSSNPNLKMHISEYEILYRGGDGDPIDMAYGCDLIISKDDKIETVQVKTKEISAIEASKNSNYSSIDLFYWSDNGNVGRVGGEDVSTLF